MKRTLLRAECVQPPREIRDNTKERRAWLAAKVEEINKREDREAKIVGTGSYQSVSVYEVKEVEGRLRLRGHCQFCGNSQVVSGGKLVLHGYTRPGDGQVWGECPGMRKPALNVDKTYTEKWLKEARESRERATIARDEAKRANEVTSAAWYEQSDEQRKAERAAKPAALRSWVRHTKEEEDAFKQAYSVWAAQFPVGAAYDATARELAKAEAILSHAVNTERHFQTLIDMKLHGRPLTQEVVA